MVATSLAGTTVVVTGGNRGIGAATADDFVRRGAKVAVLSREPVSTMEAVGPGELLAVEGDVTNDESITRAFRTVENRFGTVDILVNNAGVATYEPFLDASLDTWQATFEVNVLGIVRCIRAVLPGMLERGHGRIVNVASRQGIEGAPNASSYATSKAAVVNLGKCLEQELLSSGVLVSTVSPAGARTDFAGVPAADKSDTLLSATDVAQAIVYAATTSENAYLRDLVLLPAVR